MPSSFRFVKPPRVVEVRRDDTWYRGSLEAWRREDGDWLAFVRYSVGVGMQYLDWVDTEHVRPHATLTS